VDSSGDGCGAGTSRQSETWRELLGQATTQCPVDRGFSGKGIFPCALRGDHCACESQVGDRRKSESRRLATGLVSERPAWGWTTLAMLLTNSWFRSRDGEKRPPANAAGARGWRFRRKSARNGETRKCRKHGQLRGCGRREALTGGPESLREKKLARQAKQRVFYEVETLVK